MLLLLACSAPFVGKGDGPSASTSSSTSDDSGAGTGPSCDPSGAASIQVTDSSGVDVVVSMYESTTRCDVTDTVDLAEGDSRVEDVFPGRWEVLAHAADDSCALSPVLFVNEGETQAWDITALDKTWDDVSGCL